MSDPTLNILHAYIENQMQSIGNLSNKVHSLDPVNEDQTVHLAYELHNIYCAYEDLFKEVAKSFENEIQDASQFHKGLLQRMQLDIKGIRPKVIGQNSYELLLEMLGFRHVFRHAYNYNLSPQKVKELKDKYLNHSESIKGDINGFLKFLEDNINQ